ncbi:MAG: hypothetical protein IKW83_06545 [Muribaculaceae bacterium]|nr:hypothetical protein [Muribaculaceae bacterium]
MASISKETIDRLCNISCEYVAERLGMVVQKHRTICFMHDDHHPSLSFFGKNRNFWHCFVCNKGGSSIDLVREYSGLDFVSACIWLGQLSGISIKNTKPKHQIVLRPRIIKQSEDNIRPFSIKVANWILENSCLTERGKEFLFHQRKLSPDVINQLKIVSIDDPQNIVSNISKTFDPEIVVNSSFFTFTKNKIYFRMFTPCLILPYYDQEWNLIGMQSRYLGTNAEAPRFQFISAQKARLFNLPILNTMKYGDHLFISEGITDCLALLSSGKKAVALPSSTILPKNDLSRLVKFSLHMYPDQDNAGKFCFNNLKRFFINHFVYLRDENLPKGFKDFSEYYLSIKK